MRDLFSSPRLKTFAAHTKHEGLPELSASRSRRNEENIKGADSTESRVKAVLERARRKRDSQSRPKQSTTRSPKAGVRSLSLDLSPEALLQFERSGHLTTKRLLSHQTVHGLHEVLRANLSREHLLSCSRSEDSFVSAPTCADTRG